MLQIIKKNIKESIYIKKKIERFSFKKKQEIDKVISVINKSKFTIKDVTSKIFKRNPLGPFTTSTLQQTASGRFGFGATRTMQIAQKLYQGIEIEGETIGLITYMRTDGTNISKDAVSTFRDYIKKYQSTPNNQRLKKIIDDIIGSGKIQKDDLTIVVIDSK